MRASRVGLSLVVEASTQREGHVAQGVVADPPTRPGFPPYSLLSPEPSHACLVPACLHAQLTPQAPNLTQGSEACSIFGRRSSRHIDGKTAIK